jgi:hypothetical protein
VPFVHESGSGQLGPVGHVCLLWGNMSNQRAIRHSASARTNDLDVGMVLCSKDFLRALDDQDPQTIVRALRITADRIEADEREQRQARTRSDDATPL